MSAPELCQQRLKVKRVMSYLLQHSKIYLKVIIQCHHFISSIILTPLEWLTLAFSACIIQHFLLQGYTFFKDHFCLHMDKYLRDLRGK